MTAALFKGVLKPSFYWPFTRAIKELISVSRQTNWMYFRDDKRIYTNPPMKCFVQLLDLVKLSSSFVFFYHFLLLSSTPASVFGTQLHYHTCFHATQLMDASMN